VTLVCLLRLCAESRSFSLALQFLPSIFVPAVIRTVAGGGSVLFLSPRIKRLEFSLSELYFHDGFPNTPVRCSVKCVRGLELF
jgi:hypothetical protein